MKKFMHVCMTPALIDQFDVSRSIVVVIDILRATTSMCVAFGHGARLMVPMADIEECRALKDKGFLIAGERSGIQVEGFDMGNSPYSFMGPEIKDAKIAITTTNGTKAMKAAQERGAKEIVVGAFSNISLLVQWLIEQDQHVTLLCSAWRDNVTLEDTIFAGAVAQKLRFNFRPYQDTTLVATTLYKAANTRKRYFFRNSSHFHRLVHLNLQNDVKYAMRRDTQNVIPLLIGDELHDIAGVKDDLAGFKQEILQSQPKKEDTVAGN